MLFQRLAFLPSPAFLCLTARLLLACGGVGGASAQSININTCTLGDLAAPGGGPPDLEFSGQQGWSASAGASAGVLTAAVTGGDYVAGSGGKNVRGTGAAGAYIGAKSGYVPFDAETGGTLFNALAAEGSPVTTGVWSDVDGDGRFDMEETGMQAGLVLQGGVLEFGLQGAGMAAVVGSGVVPVMGKWYSLAAVHGAPEGNGQRVIRLHIFNQTDNAAVDFDPAKPGVQPWQTTVEPAFYGPALRSGLVMRVTGESAAIDNLRPFTWTKESNNTALNLPKSWRDRVVPGPEDVVLVDSTVTSYQTAPIGSSMAWKGIRLTNPGNPLQVYDPAGAFTLTLGAGGITLQALPTPTPLQPSFAGTTYGLYFNANLVLTADQTWHVMDANSSNRDLSFDADAESVIDLGGRTVTRTGNGQVTVGGGFDVANGTMILQGGLLGLVSGGSGSRSLAVPVGTVIRAETGAEVNFTRLSGEVDFKGLLQLSGGTLSVAPRFTSTLYNSFQLDGTVDTGTASTTSFLTSPNANAAPPSGLEYVIASTLTGSGTLRAGITTARLNDRVILTGNNAGFSGTFKVDGTGGNRTLRLGAGQAGSAAASWQVDFENVLEVHGVSLALGTLGGQGIVLNSKVDSTAVVTVGSGMWQGSLKDGAGVLALTKTGPGTLTLGPNQFYTGATTVEGGTLVFTGPVLTDSSVLNVQGPGSSVRLDYADKNRISKLYLDGVLQVSGVWGGPDSTAAHRSPRLAGTGLLEVLDGAAPPVLTPYQTWIAGFATLAPGEAQASGADPDGDGLINLAEFAFDSNPAAPVPATVLTVLPVTLSTGPAVVLSFPLRQAASPVASDPPGGERVYSGENLIYRIQGSSTLSTWDAAVEEITLPADTALISASLPTPAPGWQRRSFRLTSLGASGFLRVVIGSIPN